MVKGVLDEHKLTDGFAQATMAKLYAGIFTRCCFSSAPFCGSVGWGAQWGENRPLLRDSAQIHRLVEMEYAIRPVPVWTQQIARQIDEFPQCGWAFRQQVEAVCTNIGRSSAITVEPVRCFTAGPGRLAVVSHVALLLDGWLQGIDGALVVRTMERQDDTRQDWSTIVSRVWAALGDHGERKVLLVSRLLERLRFWLRAPYGTAKPDDNCRLGYLYVNEMAGGFDYFGFDNHGPVISEINRKLIESVDTPNRWLEVMLY